MSKEIPSIGGSIGGFTRAAAGRRKALPLAQRRSRSFLSKALAFGLDDKLEWKIRSKSEQKPQRKSTAASGSLARDPLEFGSLAVPRLMERKSRGSERG